MKTLTLNIPENVNLDSRELRLTLVFKVSFPPLELAV